MGRKGGIKSESAQSSLGTNSVADRDEHHVGVKTVKVYRFPSAGHEKTYSRKVVYVFSDAGQAEWQSGRTREGMMTGRW